MARFKPIEPNIYLDELTGHYIIRKSKKGKDDLWRSTGSSSILKARRDRDVFTSEWLGQGPKKESRHSFESLFEEVLRIKATKSFKTHQSAEIAIRMHLKPWFKDNCPFVDSFKDSTWEDYITAQRGKGARRLKHDREILIFTLMLARKKELVSKIFTLRKPDEKREVGKDYEDDEIQALIDKAPTKDLQFQIRIAVKMGMRLREILHLSWDRVDLKKGLITLTPETTKTKKKRFVPIHVDLLEEFKTRRAASKSIFVFPSPGNMKQPVNDNKHAWQTAKSSSGVEGRFHDLRHKAMTDMLAAGIPSFDVSKITGASEQVIQRIYHHLRDDTLERMRNLNCGKFVAGEKK